MVSRKKANQTSSPTWLLIRNLGKIKYFNVSYLVLIAVPILADVRWITVPCTIKWAYLASLFYAIAIATYQFMCPKIIKDYEKEQDYLSDNLDILQREYPEFKIEIVLANLTNHEKKLKEKIESLILEEENSPDKDETRKKLDNIVDSAYPRCLQRSLIGDYKKANIENPWAIWVSGIFFSLGTVILIVLLLYKSYHVFFNS